MKNFSMMTKCCGILLFITGVFGSAAFSQESGNSGWIGKRCPDIGLTILRNGHLERRSIASFRGKTVIVDFWATWCVPCINGLPRLDSIQKTLGNKVQVLLVSSEDPRTVERFFAHWKEKGSLGLVSAVNEQRLRTYFKHAFIPYSVIIDPRGVVVAIPNSEDVTVGNVHKWMLGQQVGVKENADVGLAREYDFRPLLVDDKFKTPRIYYSMLGGYNPNLPGLASVHTYRDSSIGGRITLLNVPISMLYSIAFGEFGADGKMFSSFGSTRIMIRSRDSNAIQRPRVSNRDEWFNKHAYCYELIVPPALVGKAHEMMRKDLSYYFGYAVKVEKENVRCWVLKRPNVAGQDFHTKGGPPVFDMDLYYATLRDTSMAMLDEFLDRKYLPGTGMPFVDETGIEGNVDLRLDGKMSNPDSLRVAFAKVGLEFGEETRAIEVLVIEDGEGGVVRGQKTVVIRSW